jgi:hypothetical protein
MIEERRAADWWDDFAEVERGEFERTGLDLVGPKGRFAIQRITVAGVARRS